MNDLAIKFLTAEPGYTHIFAVGQAGFIVKTASGKLISIDLYLSDCVERLEGHMGYKRLCPKILKADEVEFDAVVCTHPHWDHFDVDSVPQMLANGRTRLYCSVDCEKLVKQTELEYFNENITYVKPGDMVDEDGFALEFVNCDHGEGAPDAVGVVIHADGRRIYEAGDTCLRLDRVGEIKQPLDVLIAPINGAYGNMNSDDCVEFAKALKPRLTIPCHYGMFASHGGDPGRFFELMKEAELPMLLMTPGEKYSIK
ncbi:MAG: MBL fold metallo-hydrolase [Firmicutes bacterium]|nr:MBL fold metallo-hydrolase [Bacillota bacterium]